VRVPSGPEAEERVRTIVRSAIALAVSAGLCLIVWQLVPNQLNITTPIVGYPIFRDYDYNRYFDAFYLVAIVFPLCVLGLVVLLGRRGPFAQIRPRSSMFPVATAPIEDGFVERSSNSLPTPCGSLLSCCALRFRPRCSPSR